MHAIRAKTSAFIFEMVSVCFWWVLFVGVVGADVAVDSIPFPPSKPVERSLPPVQPAEISAVSSRRSVAVR